MQVRNNAARLYILGDHNNTLRRKGTKLMPGAVTTLTDPDEITIKCIQRAIDDGKPIEILDAPKPKKAKRATESKSDEPFKGFGSGLKG